jgi:Bor protein
MKKLLILYGSLLILASETTSCTTLRVSTDRAQAADCNTCSGTLNRLFWGYAYHGEYQVNRCDSKKLVSVQVKTNFWQGAVTVLTLGIYCPVTITWECAKEK